MPASAFMRAKGRPHRADARQARSALVSHHIPGRRVIAVSHQSHSQARTARSETMPDGYDTTAGGGP